jgi:hypothetical protein
VNAEQFDLAQGTLEEARSTAAWALEQQQALIPVLEGFEQAAERRLACSICLWSSGGQASHDGDNESTRTPTTDVTTVVETLNVIGGVMVHLRELHRFMAAGRVLVHFRSLSTDPESFNRRIPDIERSTANLLQRLRDAVTGVPCPSWFTSEPMDGRTMVRVVGD